MEFALSEEQRLFADSLRDFLTDRLPMEAVRRIAEAGNGFDEDIWHGLCRAWLPGLRCRNDSVGRASAYWMPQWLPKCWVPR